MLLERRAYNIHTYIHRYIHRSDVAVVVEFNSNIHYIRPYILYMPYYLDYLSRSAAPTLISLLLFHHHHHHRPKSARLASLPLRIWFAFTSDNLNFDNLNDLCYVYLVYVQYSLQMIWRINYFWPYKR